ncbi:hypothetical protein GCM10022207_24310 [Streptomyces lannensis]|uniref:Uncharacterized protein n=1 Tax=Streptomyces lannensis TaxID=766498 RepID=A0ABP7K024_9ACTN
MRTCSPKTSNAAAHRSPVSEGSVAVEAGGGVLAVVGVADGRLATLVAVVIVSPAWARSC